MLSRTCKNSPNLVTLIGANFFFIAGLVKLVKPVSDIRNETEALLRMPKQRLRFLQLVRPQLLRQSEDCLYLNLFVPASDHSDSGQGKKNLKTGSSFFNKAIPGLFLFIFTLYEHRYIFTHETNVKNNPSSLRHWNLLDMSHLP